ncbi:MAG: hypothetical protein K6T88_08445 [Bacillus sp. (in: Bacteria)]|nr:hypothetical protein [Bacillus sp. (in: firmicutes)]
MAWSSVQLVRHPDSGTTAAALRVHRGFGQFRLLSPRGAAGTLGAAEGGCTTGRQMPATDQTVGHARAGNRLYSALQRQRAAVLLGLPCGRQSAGDHPL